MREHANKGTLDKTGTNGKIVSKVMDQSKKEVNTEADTTRYEK